MRRKPPAHACDLGDLVTLVSDTRTTDSAERLRAWRLRCIAIAAARFRAEQGAQDRVTRLEDAYPVRTVEHWLAC